MSAFCDDEKPEPAKVRVKSYSSDSISLALKNADRMQGVLAGMKWFGVDDGEPVFLDRRKPLPELTDDDAILPFFNGGASHKLVDLDKKTDSRFSPSFHIQHLCGYNWTQARYEAEAEKLARWGFECLRSRRGADGRYWETWLLPGSWRAEAELGEHIASLKATNPEQTDREECDAVIRWLCRNASFGTLDVTVQRAAMTMDD